MEKDPTKPDGWAGTPTNSWQNLTFTKAQTYLKKRGFTEADIDNLRLAIVPITEVPEYVPHVSTKNYHAQSAAIILPHFNPLGEPYGYATARIIQPDIKVATFGDQAKPLPKLLCPGNITPRPHFSRLNGPLKDYVYITESRLKADVIAKCGFYAVGLNGVWGWSHKNSNSRVLGELWEFPWTRTRGIVFVPDSNTDNPDVMSAVVQFAANMRLRNVEVRLLCVPKTKDGENRGIDDFYADTGHDATVELLNSETQPIEKDEITSRMWQLNDKVVFVRNMSRYAEIDTGHVMSYGEFTKGNYGNWVSFTEEGKPVPIALSWNAWKGRREVGELAYRPGLSPLVDGKFLNLWRGMGCDPEEGDASPFVEMLSNNFPRDDELKWILQWLAYPLQNLGVKLATSLVMVGPQGTGKSLLGSIMARIYGHANSSMITREQVDSTFNSIYAAKQFVVVDEMSKNSRRDMAQASSNKLKNLITEPRLVVNRKGTPEYEIENRMNIMMTSNHLDAIHLEYGDRRFFIAEVTAKQDRSRMPEYWQGFTKWAFDNIGVIYHYLLQYDTTGFDPYAAAIETEAKKGMVEASYSDEQQLAKELIESPNTILKLLGFPQDLDYVVAMRILEGWYTYQGKNLKPTRAAQMKFGNYLKSFGLPDTSKVIRVAGELLRGCKLTPGEWDNDKARKDLSVFLKKG